MPNYETEIIFFFFRKLESQSSIPHCSLLKHSARLESCNQSIVYSCIWIQIALMRFSWPSSMVGSSFMMGGWPKPCCVQLLLTAHSSAHRLSLKTKHRLYLLFTFQHRMIYRTSVKYSICRKYKIQIGIKARARCISLCGSLRIIFGIPVLGKYTAHNYVG